MRCEALVADLAGEDGRKKLERWMGQHEVEVFINNAGFGLAGSFSGTDLSREQEMIDLNVYTLHTLMKTALQAMRQTGGGYILNVASSAGLFPGGPYMATYYATKAYVLSFSEAMAEELKGTGVTCTCLCPGPTQTNFWQRANVTASPIMKFFKPDTADHVAYKGVEGLMKKRVVVFNNVSGQLLNLAVRVMPRAVIRKSVGFMNGRR